jgi:hypothetical protein
MQPAIDYQTVFLITNSHFDWWFGLAGLLAVPIGLLAIRFRAKTRFPKYTVVWGGFFLVFGLLWSIVATATTWSARWKAVHAYETHDYLVVEGSVEDFQPMPYNGHQDECFSVRGQQFCYSDYGIMSGFHQSASHGGPIRAGLPVRVFYSGNTILRLDVASDRAPSVEEMRDTAERGKYEGERDMQELRQSPQVRRMNLIFSISAVLIAFLWNWKWRAYILFYRVRNPESIFAYLLRGFAACCLLGASWHLIGESKQPHSANDWKSAVMISLIVAVGIYLPMAYMERRATLITAVKHEGNQ